MSTDVWTEWKKYYDYFIELKANHIKIETNHVRKCWDLLEVHDPDIEEIKKNVNEVRFVRWILDTLQEKLKTITIINTRLYGLREISDAVDKIREKIEMDRVTYTEFCDSTVFSAIRDLFENPNISHCYDILAILLVMLLLEQYYY